MHSFPLRNKILVLAIKKYTKVDITDFCLCPICLTSLLFSKYFVPNNIEAVIQRCSVKRVLEISQSSTENTCARVSLRPGTLRTPFFYGTPLVVASDNIAIIQMSSNERFINS